MIEKENPGEASVIPTLNHRGYMQINLDIYSQRFVDFCAQGDTKKVLDVGAAFGVATLAALEKGAHVTAIDPEPKHLEILCDKVVPSDLDRLSRLTGALPDLELESSSFDAILCSRVLHFLSGDDVERSIALFHQAIKPGGQLFLITETPYVGIWQSIIPSYERKKLAGEMWPALMPNFSEYVSAKADPDVAPNMLNPLDLWQLERILKNAGFAVIQSGYIDRSDFPERMRLDGRESAGAIGVKAE